MATDNTNSKTGNDSTSQPGDVLNIRDVLSGIAPEGADAATLGACIIFETVGNDTVVSVDIDGAGPAAPLPILTLANVTGKTLQDLLSDVPTNA
ncbi:MAG: type I secretion C-terminal target domain-containing protein [Betaproteobacteria bacterium]|nr:type I secretion C-terminal target domain-containing protein [Betaproteobacteria bacterium]